MHTHTHSHTVFKILDTDNEGQFPNRWGGGEERLNTETDSI